MDERRRHYLEAMGIQTWERRQKDAPAAPEFSVPAPIGAEPFIQAVSEDPAPSLPVTQTQNDPHVPAVTHETPLPVLADSGALEDEAIACMDWAALKSAVDRCTRCPELVANRTQTVFGVGNRKTDIMVIGEAPGADEDKQGEPFVGRAGQLLNEMLRAMGYPRETVYIANVLKSRPPNNRDPKPDEVAHCEPYLKRQIELIKPKLILSVGRISAQNLLKTETPIGKLRGTVHRYQGIPLVVTYHPAYLLRSPLEKRKAWEDLKLALRTFREQCA